MLRECVLKRFKGFYVGGLSGDLDLTSYAQDRAPRASALLRERMKPSFSAIQIFKAVIAVRFKFAPI